MLTIVSFQFLGSYGEVYHADWNGTVSTSPFQIYKELGSRYSDLIYIVWE
jgi:hypothetical protein